MKLLLRIFVLTSLAVGAYFAYLYYYPKAEENPYLRTLYGNVEQRTLDLAFEVSGRLISLNAFEGDTVKKGEQLARLDDTVYEAQYSKALFQITLAQADVDLSKNTLARNQRLYQTGAISKEQYDILVSASISAQARLDMVEQEAQIAKNNLDNTKLYAPNDAFVSMRFQEEGAMILASVPVFELTLSRFTWVRAYITEKDLGNIRYGQEVRIITDTIDPNTQQNKEYKAYIGYIASSAEFTPKTVQTEELRAHLVYKIQAYILERDDFLRQGMPVTLEIDFQNRNIKSDLKDVLAQ